MENKKNYEYARLATLVMLVFSFLLLVTGITYAVFRQFSKGTTENFIEAGMLSFAFNENVSSENKLYIEDALPVLDSVGKKLHGPNEYFDFSVSSTATIADIFYEVVVQEQPGNTMDASFVKAYLTTINGTIETASKEVMENDRVKEIAELNDAQNSTGKVVYIGTVKEGSKNYHQDFRLRMWISNDIEANTLPYNQNFSIKVRINAIEK